MYKKWGVRCKQYFSNFIYKLKTAYELRKSLGGSEMCIRESPDFDAVVDRVRRW